MELASKNLHFIGIGGAGMGPLAEYMFRCNFIVTGSDLIKSPSTERLESLGIPIQYDHNPSLIKKAELVVYSSAVKSENSELMYAHAQAIKAIKRAEMLGEITKFRYSIGVAGTHGKTTTTAMLGKIFYHCGQRPTVLVGGEYRDTVPLIAEEKENVLILEADEYDRSFLKMFPSVAVITNIESDHLDIYKDIHDIIETFSLYVKNVGAKGMIVLCEDDENSSVLKTCTNHRVISFGLAKSADYRADQIHFDQLRSTFHLIRMGDKVGRIELPIPGVHNVYNALAAITVSCEMGISFEIIQESLKHYRGVKRRFEIIGSAHNIMVIDDYAHHPSAIETTLKAAGKLKGKRVIAIFQPHLYSRTRDYLDDFAHSLLSADMVIITDIYKAREEEIPGVRSTQIIEKMNQYHFHQALYIENMNNIPQQIIPMLRSGDIIVCMGAGDIGKIAQELYMGIQNG